MKIKKKAAIAAALLTMTNFSACSNYNQDVYGPPLTEWEQEETDTEAVNNDTTRSEEDSDPDTSEETTGDEQQ